MSKDPLLVGQLDLLLLAVLARGPAHGYAIIERLRSGSRQVLEYPEGTLYPALYRLERAGLVRSENSQVSGRKRRTYYLTKAGTATLQSRRASWREFASAVEAVLRGGAVRGHAR